MISTLNNALILQLVLQRLKFNPAVILQRPKEGSSDAEGPEETSRTHALW